MQGGRDHHALKKEKEKRKMRGLKKCISTVLAAALVFTALPMDGLGQAQAAGSAREAAVDATVKVLPDKSSPFNDTDGDGLGEFEGWGTSLCWWANRLGYDTTMTNKAAEAFFDKEKGLGLNIGRYNVGGGDNTGDTPLVTPNDAAEVFGVEKQDGVLSYAGSSMKVNTESRFKDAVYLFSDADFGFTKGQKVGEFQYVGWVNKLSDTVGSGDHLHYTVNAQTATNYTVKLLGYHNSSLTRDIAIKVNGETEYVVTKERLLENKIANSTTDNKGLFLATIKDVALKQGANTIEVAGKDDWTLDFVNMLVVETSKEGTLPEADPFLHPAHIKRSDSDMPGYWKDVTKIDTQKHTIEWYKQNFARADEECGYAWNYDWNKDANQRNILNAAKKASGDEFIAEAFSNSPPYFMTVSGCTSGAASGSSDNLRKDSYNAFAAYMADVIAHYAEAGIVDFTSATAMNEPYTSYWSANSAKQEGCHFDQGDSESNMILAFQKALKEKAEASTNQKVQDVLNSIILSGTDETSIDTAIDSYNKLSSAAKKAIQRIDTHTYGGSKRAELSELAQKANKNLWMSEIDGASRAGTDAGEMAGGLGFAQRIITDINGLKSSAWIMWNAVDLNVDANNEFDADSIEDLKTKTNDSGEIMYDPDNKGWWGIAIGDHNNKELVLTRKYYAYGQFSRYIRPGYTIMGTSDDANTLVAYDPEGSKAVIVAVNTAKEDKTWKFDLSRFETMGSTITATRTSGSSEEGENWVDVSASVNTAADTANKAFTATVKGNSITTFVVDGVTFDKEKDDEYVKRQQNLEKMQTEIMSTLDLSDIDLDSQNITLTEGMVSGSAPYQNSTTNTVAKVIDGDFSTFFDGVSSGYVQIDLGAGNAKAIAAYGYAPRYVNNDSQYVGRCVGASLYGSNDATNWELLHTIAKTPEGGKFNYAYANEFASAEVIGKAYRYYKYAVTASGNCNIAELSLYEMPQNISVPELPDTLEKWVTYCEGKTNNHNYSQSTKTAYDRALAAAKALSSSSDATAREDAMYALFEAYLNLKEIYNYTTFSGADGATIYDNNGEVIQAHGGQVQRIQWEEGYDFNGNGQIEASEKEFWYWIGEDKTNDYRPCPGIHAYISQDLFNWVDMGRVLRTVPNWETFTTDKYFTDLYGNLSEDEQKLAYNDIWTDDDATDSGCVIERPKMIYNEKTKQYVIWFHADGQIPGSSGGNYAKAKAGVAVSSSPFGPFQMKGSYLLNYVDGLKQGFADGHGNVRDMNLFKDDDGTAYVIYSSDGNANMYIAKLNDSYTNIAKTNDEGAIQGVDFSVNFIGSSREAPAMFKYNDKYYLITSGCSGWSPNAAQYAVADTPLGPWKVMGDPCTDEDANTTYFTQSTCVIPMDAEKGQYIYMGDRWYNPEISVGPGAGGSLRDSRYVWLPIEFTGDGEIALRKYSDWDKSIFENIEPYEVVAGQLPATAKSVAELQTKLPATLKIKLASDTAETTAAVVWDTDSLPEEKTLGEITVSGTMTYTKNTKEHERAITHKVTLWNEKLIYFFDCAAEESQYHDILRNELQDKLRNADVDQPYSVENLAGYTGENGGEGIASSDTTYDFGVKSDGDDMWSIGYWATKNSTIDYAFVLEKGTYTVATGYHEWWSGDRNTKIVVTSNGKDLVSSDTFKVAGSKKLQKNVAFTLTENAKVTVSITGSGADPILSWIAVIQDEKQGSLESEDKEALQELIGEAESVEKGNYTDRSWEKFQEALEKAVEVQRYVLSTQEEIAAAVLELRDAMNALQTPKEYLQSSIEKIAISATDEKNYEKDAMWTYYQEVLSAARALAEEEGLTEAEAEEAVKDLQDAVDLLTPAKQQPQKPGPSDPTDPTVQKKEQVINVKASITKAFGDKAFDLGAKTNGDGKLSYTSSDKKVADYNAKNGKIEIKGCGICTITVTAQETANYKSKTANVTLTVNPKKAALSKLKPGKKQLKVTWKKDTKASGYEVQCCLNKKFKSGVKKVDIKKAKTTSTTIKKLKKGKKYYVRIRAYKTVKVNGKTKKLTGAWSKVLTSKKVK